MHLSIFWWIMIISYFIIAFVFYKALISNVINVDGFTKFVTFCPFVNHGLTVGMLIYGLIQIIKLPFSKRKKNKLKRQYSSIDPYGEENWSN